MAWLDEQQHRPVPSPTAPRKRRSGEPSLAIKAVNPDNFREAGQLVELFTAAYGTSYFHKQVYDPHFWFAKDGTEEEEPQLTSIVALDENRFIGHLALKGAGEPGINQLLLPAVHPAYRKQVFEMSRVFWQCVESMARRQGWRLVYHFSHVAHPISQVVAAKCFRSVEVALIPNYILPARYHVMGMRRCKLRTSLVAMYNVFDTSALPTLTIYPPEHHADIIRELYYPLRLDRVFKQGADASPWRSPSHVGRQDGHSPSPLEAREFELDKLTIIPSQITNIEQLLRVAAEASKTRGRRLFIQIALDDPYCALTCRALESYGYRFCGVLPLLGGRDYILYSEFENEELEALTLYSHRAKALRAYLISGVSDTSRFH